MDIRIPFNRATFVGRELEYVGQAVAAGHISGDGAYTRRCHELLRDLTGARDALLTTSCTHALEMAALLLELGPGDEVIVPSFSFVSCANPFVLRGARPVFADVREDTLNVDHTQLPSLITSRTRAVLVLHYAGVAAEMDAILETCGAAGVDVVEDNAHGFLGTYRGRPLGSFGRFASLSFHETKNLTCGEGGALLLNRDDDVARAEVLREKGTDRSRFFRGLVDRYRWVDVGSSYLPSDMLAAILFAQLEQRDAVQARRRELWDRYRDGLATWAASSGVGLPHVPPECEHPAHLFYLVMPTGASRDRLLESLRQAGILAVFHYLPLHLSPMGARFGGREGQCPVTERVSERLLRLPLYHAMTPGEQDEVIQRVVAFAP